MTTIAKCPVENDESVECPDGLCVECQHYIKAYEATESRAPSGQAGFDLLSADSQGGIRTKMYTYHDMVAAFTAGRRNQKECGDTENDCWDFATWCYKNYGI